MFNRDKAHVSLPDSIPVGAFRVRKLRLKEYVQVFNTLEKIPTLLSDLPDQSNETILQNLAPLIAQALPEFMQLMALVTDESVDRMELLDLSEAVDIVAAAIKVNDFLGVHRKVKGIPDQLKSEAS